MILLNSKLLKELHSFVDAEMRLRNVEHLSPWVAGVLLCHAALKYRVTRIKNKKRVMTYNPTFLKDADGNLIDFPSAADWAKSEVDRCFEDKKVRDLVAEHLKVIGGVIPESEALYFFGKRFAKAVDEALFPTGNWDAMGAEWVRQYPKALRVPAPGRFSRDDKVYTYDRRLQGTVKHLIAENARLRAQIEALKSRPKRKYNKKANPNNTSNL